MEQVTTGAAGGRADGPADGPADGATAEVRTSGRVSPRRAFWSSFGVFFVLFALWGIGNPLGAAPDEPSHATKAAAVVRGQLVGEPIEGQPDGFGSVDAPRVIWQFQAYPICYNFRADVTAACEPPETENPDDIVYAVTTASNYNPAYYAVVGLPSLLPIGENMIFLMRLISAALCAFALAWAVRSLAELRAVSWPMLGAVAATTPMVVFLASSISPAGPEICAAIGLWAGLFAIVDQPDPALLRTRMAGIAVLASVLVNLRGLSPLILAIIVVTVVASAPWASTWVTLRDRRSWPWLGVVGVASVAALVWQRTAGALPAATVKFPDQGFRRAALTSVKDTPVYLQNMVGQFGWVDTNVPVVLVVGWIGLITAMIVAVVVKGSWRERIVMVALGGVTLGVPIVIHAWQAKYIGIVWQGRYFLPVAVGLPLLAGFVLRRHAVGTVGRFAGRWLPWGMGALLLGQLVAMAVNLHRYAVGADGPWFGAPADAWEPPVGIPVLLVACAATLVCLFRLLHATADDVPSAAEPHPASDPAAP